MVRDHDRRVDYVTTGFLVQVKKELFLPCTAPMDKADALDELESRKKRRFLARVKMYCQLVR